MSVTLLQSLLFLKKIVIPSEGSLALESKGNSQVFPLLLCTGTAISCHIFFLQLDPKNATHNDHK